MYLQLIFQKMFLLFFGLKGSVAHVHLEKVLKEEGIKEYTYFPKTVVINTGNRKAPK